MLYLMTALTCAVCIFFLAKVAPFLGLVDTPDIRKKHTGNVPLVGGIAIFASVSVWLLISGTNLFGGLILCTGFAALILGALDDRFNLSARIRLIAQVLIAASFPIIGSLSITDLGNTFGFGYVSLGQTTSILFTIFCFVGVVNAINMSDGVDGLLGLLAASSLVVTGMLCFQAGMTEEANIAAFFVSALIPFLFFNLGFFGQSNRIFLGDGGSVLVGVVLVAFFIHASQGQSTAFDAVTAGWLLGLPLVDSVVVMFRRSFAGKSPLAADRDHLHHLLLDSGLSPLTTTLTLVGTHWVFLATGLFAHYSGTFDSFFFWLFVVVSLVHFCFTPSLIQQYRQNGTKVLLGSGNR